MSKWKCEICNSSFENFDARGFDNKIYCPLCYYKKLYIDTELERERLTAESTEWESKCYEYQDIIKEVREKCDYLLNNDTVEINGRTYIKQEADNVVTNYIKEVLDKENEECKE